MVRKLEIPNRKGRKQSDPIEADVIILGCSLPGIVTAHKLKRKFGDTMDIVVLDMKQTSKLVSKCNVAFFTNQHDEDAPTEPLEGELDEDVKIKITDNVARHYIMKYARELHIPVPAEIAEPERTKSPLNKVFQHTNGRTVQFSRNFHDFDYLGFIEKFELNQYQSMLDHSMRDMFHRRDVDSDAERKRLLYYDQTTMEQHLCEALIFTTSREIMRTTVSLVCGAPADRISVLFYLHQCYRSNSSKNHLDGDNTRFREKLLGYCRKRLTNQLQRSIADIRILSSYPIKEISTYSDEQVILKTMKGETDYVCNLLAMALRPDELYKIRVEEQLLAKKDADITRSMTPGRAKKFVVQYETNFWEAQGYSGDILSMRGPIIWAMERPKYSTTGSLARYSTLTGYMMVREKTDADNSKDAVIEQLVKLFGDEAAAPVSYQETDVTDIFVPRCGDYVALRRLTGQASRKYLEWGALDVFADGDVAAALEAGHATYLHLLSCLRPQAQTYEDLSSSEWPITFDDNPINRWFSYINYKSTMRFAVYTAAIYIGVKLVQAYTRK